VFPSWTRDIAYLGISPHGLGHLSFPIFEKTNDEALKDKMGSLATTWNLQSTTYNLQMNHNRTKEINCRSNMERHMETRRKLED
jgi:hypothetical protein